MYNDLMTLADIAEMHRCDVRRARDSIVRLPGFPQPAPTSTPHRRVWVRAEVRAFATRNPALLPQTEPEPASASTAT